MGWPWHTRFFGPVDFFGPDPRGLGPNDWSGLGRNDKSRPNQFKYNIFELKNYSMVYTVRHKIISSQLL